MIQSREPTFGTLYPEDQQLTCPRFQAHLLMLVVYIYALWKVWRCLMLDHNIYLHLDTVMVSPCAMWLLLGLYYGTANSSLFFLALCLDIRTWYQDQLTALHNQKSISLSYTSMCVLFCGVVKNPKTLSSWPLLFFLAFCCTLAFASPVPRSFQPQNLTAKKQFKQGQPQKFSVSIPAGWEQGVHRRC